MTTADESQPPASNARGHSRIAALAVGFAILGALVLPFAASTSILLRNINVPYTIGDPFYLYVFTKAAHQVWTELLSQGSYPAGGYPDDFRMYWILRPRRFHSTEFWNGSMFVFGGHDKDMYYNDIWRYKLPTFSSDRSKWYEIVALWERNITWLIFNNNRYNHEILKDAYEQVCKDVFDSQRHVERNLPPDDDVWEMARTSEARTNTGELQLTVPYRYDPIDGASTTSVNGTVTSAEQLMPIMGRNPIPKDGTTGSGRSANYERNFGAPQQGWEDKLSRYLGEGYVENNKWVCEEIKVRYDYVQMTETNLKQDYLRPSARYQAAMKLIYSGFNESFNLGKCVYKSSGYYDMKNPALPNGNCLRDVQVMQDTCHEEYEIATLGLDEDDAAIPIAAQTLQTCLNSLMSLQNNCTHHDMYEPRVTGIDRRVHYEVPDNCRPQFVLFGGFDVNNYYRNDLWVFDLWNETWRSHDSGSLMDVAANMVPERNTRVLPRPRRNPSLNVYNPGYEFTVPHSTTKQSDGTYMTFRELLFVHGGTSASPWDSYQDVNAYDRERKRWFTLEPTGRVPSARVFDRMTFIGTVGYLVGGVYGGFKIDVTKYNVLRNKYSLMYAEGAKPSARSDFAVSVFQDSLFVFGGRGWVTVDNEDKYDMWQYNTTTNFWSAKEITGVTLMGRLGHSMITFGATLIVFGGYSTPDFVEKGIGDMDEVWRYDLKIGALLADSKFELNTGGWSGYQNYVEGDNFIPKHCDDYAAKVGSYWGQPCRISYYHAGGTLPLTTRALLWTDSLHNDTDNAPYGYRGDPLDGPEREVKPEKFLGANGIGYVSAPKSFLRVGNKAYQGRLRYEYTKVYPVNDDELERAFRDTKDDVLLVGKYQVLAFDILDELTPRLGVYTLVDIDFDEAKGWFVHGTNGTEVPTKDEFIHVLSTLQMILIRVDYYPSVYFKHESNYDDLGLVLYPQDAYEFFNDTNDGNDHNLEYKLTREGKITQYGDVADRVGTEGNDWQNNGSEYGIWKFYGNSSNKFPLMKLGRTQTHGEIIAIKQVELFENTEPLEQDFLNAKVEGRLICTTSDANGEQCNYKTGADLYA